MSKSAHAQSTYELHRLPRCSKCRQEFQLVMASYTEKEGNTRLVEEWECEKCGKTVPKHILKEEPLSKQDKYLSNWIKNEKRQQKYYKTKKK